ncbi:MAG: hypothetical protein HYV07_14505 [Deltaproteobacteria bacterium]|nr:hypothetical protein [Deltaproteobacteria bacterium]
MAIKSILKPKPSVASSPASAKPKASRSKTSAAKPADSVEPTPASKALASIAPVATIAQQTLPEISETFPIQALEKLGAKGIRGQTFMLDGGSLRGLKLRVRRVMDGGTPGFELSFRVTPSKIAPLMKKLEKAGAKRTELAFRGLDLGPDGIARFTSIRGSLSSSGTHTPSDIETNASQWVQKLEAPKGGVVELASNKAAVAVRGYVRIRLQGDDKTCTKQLDGIVKSLGLQELFAPPTQKSKQLHALMRALWQADNKKAESLSKGDLEKLKPESLAKALVEAGFSKERIEALRYEEAFEGHFSVIDPEQANVMAKAGARYLYSTVTTPEHVLSILRDGQKSSLQRYEDGMIVNGMSTNADFSTGGAVGVFTRLVTQDAIYKGNSWTGRTYKLLQTHEQLARTDWYGWEGDYFGRRWELDSKKNFGAGLVDSIDDGGKSYHTTNELIFSAGNRPENIQRVVATTEADRKKLVDHLKKEGFVPHNGLSIDEFVVLSPKFLAFGPSPYDTSDIPKLAAEAVEAAKKGASGQLRWFLMEAPDEAGLKAKVERECLLDPKLLQVALDVVQLSGRFALGKHGLDAFIDELEAQPNDAGKKILDKLTSSCASALLRSGAQAAAKLLESNPPPNNWMGPFGMDDEAWVQTFSALAKLEGGVESECFKLAMKTRGEGLLKDGHEGFVAFLRENPLVKPAKPSAWLDAQLAKVVEGAPDLELRLFVAQTPPDKLDDLRKRLIARDSPKLLEILRSTLAEKKDLGLGAADTVKLLEALPEASETRKYLLDEIPDALLVTGSKKLLDMLVERHGKKLNFGLDDSTRWTTLADALVARATELPKGYLAEVLGRGANWVWSSQAVIRAMPKLEGLFELADPKAFVKEAISDWKPGEAGPIKLLWLLAGPEETHALRVDAAVASLKTSDYYPRSVLGRIRSADEKQELPMSPTQLCEVAEKLIDAKDQYVRTSFLSMAGKQMLMAGDDKTFEILEKTFAKNKDDDLASQLGLYSPALRETLDALADRKDPAGKKGYAWFLSRCAGTSIRGSNPDFLAHLTSNKLDLEDLGLDADGAVAVAKRIAEESYYYSGSTPSEGLRWLVYRGENEADEELVGKIASKIKSWKLDASRRKGFATELANLTTEHKKKLEQLAG